MKADWAMKAAMEFALSLSYPLQPHEIAKLGKVFADLRATDPNQIDLDFSQYEHPTARPTDPISSHLGVDREVTRQQRKIVLAEVKMRQGRTARELAGESGLDFEMVHKRLPELRTEGKVFNRTQGQDFPSTRRCSVTGRRAMEWWPTS